MHANGRYGFFKDYALGVYVHDASVTLSPFRTTMTKAVMANFYQAIIASGVGKALLIQFHRGTAAEAVTSALREVRACALAICKLASLLRLEIALSS